MAARRTPREGRIVVTARRIVGRSVYVLGHSGRQRPGARPAARIQEASETRLSEHDARILVSDRDLANFYEDAVKAAGGEPRAVANWVTGEVLRYLKNDGGSIARTKIRPEHIGSLVKLVMTGAISFSSAKDVFAEVIASGKEPEAIVQAKGLSQVSDEAEIAAAVDAVLAENTKAIADYKAGNARALGALVGPVMKKMGGKANPAVINKVLVERIDR